VFIGSSSFCFLPWCVGCTRFLRPTRLCRSPIFLCRFCAAKRRLISYESLVPFRASFYLPPFCRSVGATPLRGAGGRVSLLFDLPRQPQGPLSSPTIVRPSIPLSSSCVRLAGRLLATRPAASGWLTVPCRDPHRLVNFRLHVLISEPVRRDKVVPCRVVFPKSWTAHDHCSPSGMFDPPDFDASGRGTTWPPRDIRF